MEYKKKYEQTKAHYHIALDTAEQLHHKENAVLHSQVILMLLYLPYPHTLHLSDLLILNYVWFQVKYREEYEKNKGRSQMEFGDTQMYKVSKEAQKIQSEVKPRLLCVIVCLQGFLSTAQSRTGSKPTLFCTVMQAAEFVISHASYSFLMVQQSSAGDFLRLTVHRPNTCCWPLISVCLHLLC